MESEGINILINSTVLLSIFGGACVFLLMYILRSLNEQQNVDLPKNEKHEHTDKKKDSGISKSKKKGSEGRWLGRYDKQTYSHPWLLTTMKGHTAQVLDMDFSSNGKYLASCAEEEPDPGEDLETSSSSSDYNGEVSSPSSINVSPRSKGLSRRQRKNRRREDISPADAKKPKNKKNEVNKYKTNISPLLQYVKLNLTEPHLATFLYSYRLSPEQMLTWGYPVESNGAQGKALIFKSASNVPSYTQKYRYNVSESRFDVNAQEFVPGIDYSDIKAEWSANHDSGQGSGSSSTYGDDSEESSASTDHVKIVNEINTSLEAIGGVRETSEAKKLQDFLLHNEKVKERKCVTCNRALGLKSGSSVPTYSQKCRSHMGESRFDVNAQEFVPGCDHHDSGQGSGSSSTCGDDLEESSASTDHVKIVNKVLTYSEAISGVRTPKVSKPQEVLRVNYGAVKEHKCVRCNDRFFIKNSKEYLTRDKCVYHWGKLRNATASKRYNLPNEYSCCKGSADSQGCSVGKFHVWSGLVAGLNGPFDNYVRTRPRKTLPQDGNFGVYAIDCEMCYTVSGLELTKVTVIGSDGRLVYDNFVKPENSVVDYNTRFSGITSKDLNKKGVTKTLREVQNDLMGFINADSFLIGHGLENDLRALKILHSNVVDTSVAFPHFKGQPFRRSLKSLTSCFLKREIQCGTNGHNSLEDAQACMELVLWRVRKDFKDILNYKM